MESIPVNYLNEFMSAIDEGDSNTVRDLLKKFPSLVNVNAESLELTPLYVALQYGQADIVKILISHGANVYLLAHECGTLIDLAVKVSNGKETEEICRLLVEAGVDVNQRDMLGSTPIFLAILNESADIVRVLIELGADADSKDEDGTVLLHCASEFGLKRICELLIEGGADVNAKNGEWMTPLHDAAEKGYLCVVEILLYAGADIDARNVDDRTPLHRASISEKAQVVLTLIENGANVNIVDREGQTAFQVAPGAEWTTYQRELLKMQIATNEGILDDLGIITDISWQVQLMMKYEEEVQRMRRSEIDDTNVTVHDILTKSVDQMVLYLRNADVVQALRRKDYQREFPEYADLIEGRIYRGLERKELLDEGRRFFLRRFSEFQDLVYKYSDEILSYLSNRDLRNLKGAYSSDNNDVTEERTL